MDIAWEEYSYERRGKDESGWEAWQPVDAATVYEKMIDHYVDASLVLDDLKNGLTVQTTFCVYRIVNF